MRVVVVAAWISRPILDYCGDAYVKQVPEERNTNWRARHIDVDGS
jgi:hypothetical protein